MSDTANTVSRYTPGNNVPLPKLIGSDVELGNIIVGQSASGIQTGYHASRKLLRAVDGIASGWQSAWYGNGSHSSGGSGSQDWGRKYLASNGGCAYVDLDHFEICTPEVTGARDYVAAWGAMLMIAQQAKADADLMLPEGQSIFATVNNSDRNGSSWGGHLSLLITRELFDALCVTHSDLPLSYLMAYQCSSILFTGAGKVGSENGRPEVEFQISQRADFFESLIGQQTTHRRPLVNTRDEPLCGRGDFGVDDAPADTMARLHVIFYDSTLAAVSTYLKVGVLQIILAMSEASYLRSHVLLANPLAALNTWSHDPELNSRARLRNGTDLTAVEHQMLFLEEAKAFVNAGGCDSCVPEAEKIIAVWEDTLRKLGDRDWVALMSRLDWVAKRIVISEAVERGDMSWNSAPARHLDILFSSLDPDDGVHWSLVRAGLIEAVVTEEETRHFVTHSPVDSRAWTRAMLLRRAGEHAICSINWDEVRLRISATNRPPVFRTVRLDNPLAHTRADTEHLFAANLDLLALVDSLGARDTEVTTTGGMIPSRINTGWPTIN
jgi:proteasome accessory factor A